MNLKSIFSKVIGISATVACVSMALGDRLNRLVVSLNDGAMPVYASICKGHEGQWLDFASHFCADGSVKFGWLADFIHIGYSIMSPGDILLEYSGYDLAEIVAALFVITIILGIWFKVRKSNYSL